MECIDLMTMIKRKIKSIYKKLLDNYQYYESKHIYKKLLDTTNT